MKSFIVAVCIFVVAHGQVEKLKETLNQNLEKCKEEVGASDDDVDQYKHRITPDSEAGKCLIACVNKKLNIQDADGKFSAKSAEEMEKLLQGFDDDVYSTLLIIHETCFKQLNDGSDECETGAQWFSCLAKAKLEAGIPLFLVDK